MLRLLRSKKAQNTAEYAILIALVIGVFSAMQIYVRRGLQARVKGGADRLPYAVIGQAMQTGDVTTDQFLGDPADLQYEPYYTREGASDTTSWTQSGRDRAIASDTGGKRELTGATQRTEGGRVITGTDNAD